MGQTFLSADRRGRQECLPHVPVVESEFAPYDALSTMPAAQFILCEKSSRWAVAVRAAQPESTLLIVQTRSLAQCEAALRESPASLVAVEVTAMALAAVLELIARAGRSFPAARFATLLDAGLESAEPLLREAGACEVFCSTREAASLARLASRHVALAPHEEIGWREAIASRLPWASWKTA